MPLDVLKDGFIIIFWCCYYYPLGFLWIQDGVSHCQSDVWARFLLVKACNILLDVQLMFSTLCYLNTNWNKETNLCFRNLLKTNFPCAAPVSGVHRSWTTVLGESLNMVLLTSFVFLSEGLLHLCNTFLVFTKGTTNEWWSNLSALESCHDQLCQNGKNRARTLSQRCNVLATCKPTSAGF